MGGLLGEYGDRLGQGLLGLGEFAIDALASGISDPYRQNLIALNSLEREDARLQKNRAYVNQALGQQAQMSGLDALTQELVAAEGGNPQQQFVQQQGMGYLGSPQTQADKLKFMGQMTNSYMPGTRTAANTMMRDQMSPQAPQGHGLTNITTGAQGNRFGVNPQGQSVQLPGVQVPQREQQPLVTIDNRRGGSEIVMMSPELKAEIGYAPETPVAIDKNNKPYVIKTDTTTPGEKKAIAMADRAETLYDEVAQSVNDIDPSSPEFLWSSIVESIPGSALLTPVKYQEYQRATATAMEQYLRNVSGALISDDDIEIAKKQYMPKAFEGKSITANKLRALKTYGDSLRTSAMKQGRTAEPAGKVINWEDM